ncbi:hypothetical protein UB42_07105 [Photobacterium leiognathi]|nr:hypothetical protein UB42_07105 [Photobacterium leiognathi]
MISIYLDKTELDKNIRKRNQALLWLIFQEYFYLKRNEIEKIFENLQKITNFKFYKKSSIYSLISKLDKNSVLDDYLNSNSTLIESGDILIIKKQNIINENYIKIDISDTTFNLEVKYNLTNLINNEDNEDKKEKRKKKKEKRKKKKEKIIIEKKTLTKLKLLYTEISEVTEIKRSWMIDIIRTIYPNNNSIFNPDNINTQSAYTVMDSINVEFGTNKPKTNNAIFLIKNDYGFYLTIIIESSFSSFKIDEKTFEKTIDNKNVYLNIFNDNITIENLDINLELIKKSSYQPKSDKKKTIRIIPKNIKKIEI